MSEKSSFENSQKVRSLNEILSEIPAPDGVLITAEEGGIVFTKKPDYINSKIKQVSDIDLKSALREIKRKNKEFRDSFRDPRHDNIIFY